MSSNNFILLGKNKKGYRVYELDADTGARLSKDKYFKTLREAVKYAASIQDDSEYGIVIGDIWFIL